MQQGGIRLTVEEAAQFLSDLDRGNAAMQSFGDQAQKTAQQLNAAFSGGLADTTTLHNRLLQLSEEQYASVDARARELLATQEQGITTNQAYAQAMQELGFSAESAGAAADSTGQSLKELRDAEKEAAQEARALDQAMLRVGASLTAAGAAGAGLLLQITSTASRIEELGVILEISRENAQRLAEQEGNLAKASALSVDAVQQQVEGIRNLHLSGEVANRTVANLIRYNLDWTRATELARLAQDSAVFAMKDSSQAVEGLINGITTLQPRILRTYGIMVNLNIAYEKFAKANNVAVEEMSVTQRQQAALNEVLAQAPTISGAYEAAMGTAAKQLRSLRTDIINLSEAFGEEWTPVLDIGVGALRSFIQVLIDAPDGLQAFLTSALATGSALSGLTGTMLLLGRTVPGVVNSLNALSSALSVSTGLLIGAGGLLTILGGVAGILIATQKAHEEEARAVFHASETYSDYMLRIRAAGLESYALSEALYDVAKAAEGTANAIDAIDLKEAQEENKELFKELFRLTEEYERNAVGLVDTGDAAQWFAEQLPILIDRMDAVQLAALEDTTALQGLFIAFGLTAEEAARLAQEIEKIKLERLRKELYDLENEGDRFQRAQRQNAEWTAALGIQADITAKKLARLSKVTQEGPKGFNLQGLEDTLAYTEAIAKATEDARDDFIDAWFDRNQALEKLDRDYFNKSDDLWDDYRDTVQDIEGDIAQFHAGTLKELLDLDKEYQRKRDDAWRDFQRDISDAERELAQDLADLNRERLQDLADAQQEYAQDVSDTTRDLNRDLEEMERDLAQKQEDIRIGHLQKMADLEQEFADKREDILADFAEKAQEIEQKYILDPPPPSFDDLREGLQQELRDLEQIAAERGVTPALFDPQYYAYLLSALEGTKAQELEALEDSKDEQLSLLEQELAERQALQEEAYQNELQAAQDAYEQRRAERLIQHQERLDDLKLALQREREEIKQGYANREQEARDSLAREKAELDRRYREKLEDIATQYDDEKELIREKLDEQLAAAAEKRDEGLKDLADWYDDQKEVVKQKWEDQKKEIVYQVGRANEEAALKFGEAPSAFAPTYTALQTQAYDEMKVWAETVYGWVDTLFGWLGANSPSTLMMELGKSITDGFAQGLENPSVEDLLSQSLDGATLQANIQAAMGGAQVMPSTAGIAMAPGGSSTTNQFNMQLDAHYARPQSEASLRDDVTMLQQQMMGLI